ncbi:DegT/DnrJ/EryC1/StrS family aminotransferase [Micromonospora yangpuensis]|uniref:dTDP-4-amino-4,6-dideoxygalactose transaminase n=1 Tax=Micromonospora yangpuensis TaxID=683228 RepID=A0A1C6VH30_9ACTN|nr:aminotransferase class I/II-fold pyridoxal phosphate-dependent enzyme [Micromonospora yangpuensis]SCL65592.1 dTDP-4-amino-4,6-dideoxygalactose transaminase [Micromonospora yangpuensis]
MTGHDQLAMLGGPRGLPAADASRDLVGWPVVTGAEQEAVRGVLDRGVFTSNDAGSGDVSALEREWAAYVDAPHAAAVSNGTAALELALAGLGLEPGDEVLVPAFTFIATAVAPVQRMCVPVFVDVDPVTFTMDPVAAAAAVTPRTRAIIVVHLHGLPADLTALRELADRHGLFLVEDAAQAQGATYRGRRVAAIGHVGTVSLNATKNLPTCGEGGLVTAVDAGVHERIVLTRQFGEDLTGGRARDYVSRLLAGNEKMSAVQAAFARCQLARLDEYAAARHRNVSELLGRLAELPGVVVPTCPPERTHSWHILRLRFRPAEMGFDVPPAAMRAVLHRALRAEGVPVQPYQLVALPGQQAFQELTGFGGYPWRLPGGPREPYRAEDHPVTQEVIADSLTLQRWHLNPAAGPVLRRVADAFEKVWAHLPALASMAAAAGRSRTVTR